MLLRTSSAPVLNSVHPSPCCLSSSDSDSPSAGHSHHATITPSSSSSHSTAGQSLHHSPSSPNTMSLRSSRRHRRRPSTDFISISAAATLGDDSSAPPAAPKPRSLLNRAQSESDLACISAAMSAVGGADALDDMDDVGGSLGGKHWNKRLSLQLHRSTTASASVFEHCIFEEAERFGKDGNNDDNNDGFDSENKMNAENSKMNADRDLESVVAAASVALPQSFLLSDGELYTSLDVSTSGAPLACNGKGCRPLTESECKKLGFLDLASGLGSSSGGSGGGFQAFTAIDGPDFNRDITEAHYKSLLQKDPQNPLLLRNYALFLSETKRDYKKSEEYYERAILADPEDADVLSQYAKLQWDVHRDHDRAEIYYDQAARVAPNDCYVMASYASFLWDVDDNEDNMSAPMIPPAHGGSPSIAMPLFASA